MNLNDSFFCSYLQQLDELFVSFEEKPQGAASLAQVHKAVLADGAMVAVKVQHPKVQAQSSKDIMVMEVSAVQEPCESSAKVVRAVWKQRERELCENRKREV